MYRSFVILMNLPFKKPLHFEKLWFFYVYRFLDGLFDFVSPFIMVYFLLIGFDYFQNSILIATWMLAQLIFEIPTGAIADIYGRKVSVFISYLLVGLGFIAIGLSSSFYVILAIIFFVGGASSLFSGAYMAWLVDHVKQEKFNKDLQKVISNVHSYGAIGSFIAFSLSAYVMYLNMSYVWLLTGMLFMFLSVFIFFFGPERFEKKKGITIGDSFRETFTVSKKALGYVKGHHVLFWIFLGTFVSAIVSGLGGSVLQPYLLHLGLEAYMFGPLAAIIFFVAIFAPQLSGKVLKMLKSEKNVFLAAPIIFIVFLLLLGLAKSLVIAVVLYLIFSSLGGVFGPVMITYVHKHTPSKIRATSGSVKAMLGCLGGIIGFPLSGWVLQNLGFSYAFAMAAVLLVIVFFLYLKIDDKKK